MPLTSRCDGQADCPDRSDEFHCLTLTNNSLSLRSSPDLQWRKVCSEGWTRDWSSLVCSSLGYSDHPVQTTVSPVSELTGDSWWFLDKTARPAPQSLLTFQDTSGQTCQSQSAVNIRCQPFGEKIFHQLDENISILSTENICQIVAPGRATLPPGPRWP